MKNQDFRIGNFIMSSDKQVFRIAEIDEYGFDVIGEYKEDWDYHNCFEEIEINKDWLLKFGFKKILSYEDNLLEENYELEKENVYFNYSNDWSIAIADSKKTYMDTPNYLTINKKLTDKVHLFQNLYKSLTGKEII